MKKLSNLLSVSLLLILSLGVMSCSKDKDDDDEISSAELIGTWEITQKDFYIDGERQDFLYFSEWVISNTKQTISQIIKIEFKSDNIVIFHYLNKDYMGENLTDTYESTEDVKFELSGNKITFTEIDETGRGDVDHNNCEISVNENTMTIKSDENKDDEGHTTYILTTFTKR